MNKMKLKINRNKRFKNLLFFDLKADFLYNL